MTRLSFAIAVGVTSLVLVAAIVVGGLLLARSAVAGAPFTGGPPWAYAARFAGHGAGGPGFQMPAELRDLGSLPPDQRFTHFLGVRVSLTDRNNQPLTVNVTPGTVTAADASSLTIASNDGMTRTFALDGNTAIRGKPAQGDAQQPAQASLNGGDRVVVLTLNDETTARAVVNGGTDGFGAGGFGPWHR